MIHHLVGTLSEKDAGKVVVDVGGVGLEAHVTDHTANALGMVGEPVRLLTHLSVREDEWTLFGFLREEDRAFFRLLLGVQGVGPRLALGILSGLAADRLHRAVADGDVAALTAISGVGKKTAQRLIVDLRDKVGELPGSDEFLAPAATVSAPESRDDAVDALVALGYSRSQAAVAVRAARAPNAPEDDVPLEAVVRDALRHL